MAHGWKRPAAGAGATLLAGLLGLETARAASPPFDPPQEFVVRGRAAVTVAGPHCCADTTFRGHFEATYTLDSRGQATLASLNAGFEDAAFTVSGAFLFFSASGELHCPVVTLVAPAVGWDDGAGRLVFPAGTVRLAGEASTTRDENGACGDEIVSFSGANTDVLRIAHAPSATPASFALSGDLGAVLEDGGADVYTLHVALDGGFVNRPPVAALGIETPEAPQPGCPTFLHLVGQQWESVAEANHPDGLRGRLWSNATDPDGLWPQADVVAETWFDTRDDGGRTLLGEGRRFGPVTFEFGPRHRVELQAFDHTGAWDAAACAFRVVDTTPPVVTVPAPVIIGCSTPGGATSATSPALAAFLAGASASDLVTPVPAPLPPLVAGTEVTASRLFPASAVTAVTFRFRDAMGNVAGADSTATVLDTLAPTVALNLSPATLAADGKWWWIKAGLSGTDDCGGPVAYTLVSIKSNAPALDASDVLDASYGIDDRGFYLFARAAAPGVARVYKVTYRGTDGAGNARTVTATVTVG